MDPFIFWVVAIKTFSLQFLKLLQEMLWQKLGVKLSVEIIFLARMQVSRQITCFPYIYVATKASLECRDS